MSQTFADRFAAALQAAEQSRDPGPLVDMYADESESSNLATDEPETGKEGAKTFWTDYLESFKTIQSEFHNVKCADNFAVLEWTSKGTLPTGKPIRYRGVSVLEFTDEKITKFHSYYDSAAFVAAPATATPAQG